MIFFIFSLSLYHRITEDRGYNEGTKDEERKTKQSKSKQPLNIIKQIKTLNNKFGSQPNSEKELIGEKND